MITTITMFKTIDGKLFKEWEPANIHDKKIELKRTEATQRIAKHFLRTFFWSPKNSAEIQDRERKLQRQIANRKKTIKRIVREIEIIKARITIEN